MAESAKDELERRISEYPERALPFFRGAFQVASTLSADVLSKVLDELINNFKLGRRTVDGIELREITGLRSRDSEQVASIFSLVIGLLSESEATSEEFIEAAHNRLFNTENKAVAEVISAAICARRSEISGTVETAQLGGAVLPSLSSFSTAVDLRIRVVDGKIKTALPVLVVNIDTDAENQQLWLQLTRGDIESIIKKLAISLEDMKLAHLMIDLGQNS